MPEYTITFRFNNRTYKRLITAPDEKEARKQIYLMISNINVKQTFKEEKNEPFIHK